MALVTKAPHPSVDLSTGQFAAQVADLVAGEDLDAVAPCYIKSADGKLYMSSGNQAGASPTAAEQEAAEIVGFTARAVKAGEPATLFGKGTRFHYASGMTPGDVLYIAATPGRLDTAPSALGTVAVAQALTASDVRVIRDS